MLRVGTSYLGDRVDLLRRTQNPDGGWSYFPGNESWLEPTVYAALALHGEPEATRAWTLIRSWQRPDGSWRPAADVQISTSGTALCVTLAAVREDFGRPFQKGVEWLLDTKGVESRLLNRLAARLGVINFGRNVELTGWPWKPGTSSWVEPTTQALVALKKASVKISDARLSKRVSIGEAQLLDVRCHDGGWNYGSPEALGVDLPSYPETTALALVGLQGHPSLQPALDLAAKCLQETNSPLARVWLSIALQVNGIACPAESNAMPDCSSSPDVLIAALEALAAPGGNAGLLKTGQLQ
jgi:hypothetical protein